MIQGQNHQSDDSILSRGVSVKRVTEKNYITAALGLVLLGTLITYAIRSNEVIHVLSYIAAITACFFVCESFAPRSSAGEEWQIKALSKEAKLIAVIVILQLGLSTFRFLILPTLVEVHPVVKISAGILMLLVIYPIALGLYFFAFGKYSPQSLGLRFTKKIFVAVIIIGILGGVAFTVSPEKIQFDDAYRQYGLFQMIFLGFISAAIPEEFYRVVVQTRLGRLFNDKYLGWFITALIWAVVHFPNFYSREQDMATAVMQVLMIMPLGLLWGYMTERFKSIWPSVFVHATNLWGFA